MAKMIEQRLLRATPAWFCLIMFLLCAVPVSAQAPPDTALANVLQEAKARRWILRVTADSVLRQRGVLTRITQDSIAVGSQSIQLNDLTMLERRMLDRSNIKAATLAGGLAGLAAGTTLIAWNCVVTDNANCVNDFALAIVFGLTFSGTAVGALAGGLFGGYEWERIWAK